MPEEIEQKTELIVEDKNKHKKLSQEEFEKTVLELADKGLTSEKIGEALRKQGIHTMEYKKKISEILKKENKYVVPEIKNIEEKLEDIVKHAGKNKQDKRALRDKDRVFAKLRRTKAYFSK
jgi:DNA-binding transcriptional MerR regulator